MPPLLFSLRPSPCSRFPLRRFLLFRCSGSSAPRSSSLAPYHASFARRMALAGIHPHHRIAIGVSGGPDSMALCVLATAWKKAAGRKAGDEAEPVASAFVDGLLGVVVDHGLRPESADEARLVRDRVRGMGVECEIAKCEWPDGPPKQGRVQEAAREVRYQKLLDICIKQQIGILLIAHHSDDQAELFVLRLSRQSGVLGLAGTAFVSQLFASNVKYDGENFRRYGILLVRPMLKFSKDDMYKWQMGVPFFQMMELARQDFSRTFFMEVFIIATWHIWKQRNNLIFENSPASTTNWKRNFKEECSLQAQRMKASLKVVSVLN